MLFQSFDDKQKCFAIYSNNKLVFKRTAKDEKKLGKTWSYSEFLKDREIEYAQLYCEGKTLDEVCPDYLRKEWAKSKSRLEAFYRSIEETKLDLNNHCFFDMVPRFFLEEYAQIKNKICDYVFTTYERPDNYEFMVGVTKVITEIKNKKLNIDIGELNKDLYKFKVRNFLRSVKKSPEYITYTPYKTKTGRLTTKNSFPILTMDKNYRKIIKPNNDWFVEFDFNAAELRVLLGLLGKVQPQEDIHEWNVKNVYKGGITRNEAKKKIFAWLYNPSSNDELSSKVYDYSPVVKKYFNGKQVTTYFNRTIKSDEHHALNYVLQSTAADLFLRQLIKVWNLFGGKRSYVAFVLHDSLVVDFAEEDMVKLLTKTKKVFGTTELGDFLVNVSAGKDFGSMQKLRL